MTSPHPLTRPVGFDLRTRLPNLFYDRPYAGVDDAGWDWPEEYREQDGHVTLGDFDYNCGLLTDLESLILLRDRLVPNGECEVIAVVLELRGDERMLPPYHFDIVTPNAVQATWTHLGFDIADIWLESVLVTLGGFTDAESIVLNSNGLIDQRDFAMAAAEFENISVRRDHDPLFAFSVYAV